MKSVARFLIIVVLLTPGVGLAQIAPPAPGVEMPQAYYDRIAQDPSAFQFQKAWIQKAQRAKEAREKFLAVTPGPEALSLASLPDHLRRQVSVAGTVTVPAILVNYSNVAAPFTRTQMQEQLFDGPTTSDGTIGDLYDEMSFGLLDVQGDAVGWVAAPGSDTFYEGGCNGLCGTAKTGALILTALTGVDGTVDFGDYDNDGPDGVPNSGDDDGFVDFIAIVHPEGGGECSGPNMWSHRWVVTGWPEFSVPWTSNDPRFGGGNIQVLDYTIQPSRGSITGCGAGIIEIGVYAHEFGHAFGLPDLYDTNAGGQGIGEHGLMGSGNWQDPPNPAHMGPWEKSELGWVHPQVVAGPKANYQIDYVEANDDVYQLNIVEEKFNRKSFNPIAGAYSLHCGLPTAAANKRNWAAAAGYGNSWDEAICHDFSYSGAGPVTLEYDVSFDTEAGYDIGVVKIDVGGTVSTVATYDGLGASNNVQVSLTPYLSAPTAYKVIFEFTSDNAWSDEDGLFASGPTGPFIIDNISLVGGGENYATDFETNEAGWYYDFTRNPHREYFLVENRNRAGVFDKQMHAPGLMIWHIEQSVAISSGNTSGSTTTANLRPAGVEVECADGLNQLLLGVNRGDAGDSFPGTTNNMTWNNTTTPNSKSHNDFTSNVCVENISVAGTSMTADLLGGYFAPTVASITPANAETGTTVQIADLSGASIIHGATFMLRDSGGSPVAQARLGSPDVPASNVVWIGKSLMTGQIGLNGVPAGTYDVVVQNPDGQEGVLVDGFTVDPSTPVFIQAFAAEAVDAGVELKWELYSDEAISGFRVLRRETGADADVQINGGNLVGSDSRSYFDSAVTAGRGYDYQLVVVLGDGGELLSQRVNVQAKPLTLNLEQNYPNPFNPTTTIRFTLPEQSSVRLGIYNASGQLVRSLVDESRKAGVNTAVWDGKNDSGDAVATGVYLYKLNVGTRVMTRKMVLLK